MQIRTIQTGFTKVSSAVPDRSTHRWKLAYTGLFQHRSNRIHVPVKCFYVEVGKHRVLIDAGWSKQVREHALRHLGFGLWFASEPVLPAGQAACEQLANQPLDAILMTHLDSDHISGLHDFKGVPVYVSPQELEATKREHMRYGQLAKGLSFKPFDIQHDSHAPFGLSCDVFGDGAVLAYLTPTHSAGSVIYRVQDGEDFALVVGDNGYMQASWEQGLLPGPLYNEANMRRVLQWINEQSRLPHCVGIFCAHDPIDRNYKTR